MVLLRLTTQINIMRSTIGVFISFYHDELMRLHLNFYRLSRHQNDQKRSETIRNDQYRSFAIVNNFLFLAIDTSLQILFRVVKTLLLLTPNTHTKHYDAKRIRRTY